MRRPVSGSALARGRGLRPLAFIALFVLSGSALGQDALPDLGQPRPQKPKPPYGLPAAEIVGFDFLLNRVDKALYGQDYDVSASSIRRNLHGPWVVDNDPYK